MARLGKRKTECVVKDPTVHALRPYFAEYGEIRFDVDAVYGICGKVVAEEYLHYARVDWSGRRPKNVCCDCWFRERERQRKAIQDERDYLDRMGIIQSEQDDDDDDDGNVFAGV
jgi:hypothetical protein